MGSSLKYSMQTESPVFICGEGRSGTKLLRDCLSKHSKFCSFRCETYFFVDSLFQRMRFIDEIKDADILIKAVITALISKNKPSAEKIIRSQNFDPICDKYLSEIKAIVDPKFAFDKYYLFDICANFLAKSFGKPRWIEKTPYHIYFLERILEFYPNAKFIVNYRDPRAVVASWLKKDSNKTVLGVIASWNKVAKQISALQQKNIPNIYFMKYENLISNPELVLKEICEFLGEEYEPEIMDVTVVNSFYQDQGKTGFLKEAISRWKSNLTVPQINIIEKLTREHRGLLGYEDSGLKCNQLDYFIGLLQEIFVFPSKKLTKLFKWVRVK
jgi:hypothetical protein